MDQAERIVSQVEDLPAFPLVAAKVMELVADVDFSIKKLEALLSCDQALTARLLKVSNSAFFGSPGTISTLGRAISVLGARTLQSIVITASTEALFRSKNLKDKLLWEHALTVALASRFLAGEFGYPHADDAYVGGVMHDIGKVVIDQNLGDRYQAVITLVYNEGVTFLVAEKEMLGFDHTDVGRQVVRKWNLPVPLEEAVKYHHHPRESEEYPTLCAIVSLANAMAVKLGIGPERSEDIDLSGLEAAGILGVDGERLDGLLESLKERIEVEQELFSTS